MTSLFTKAAAVAAVGSLFIAACVSSTGADKPGETDVASVSEGLHEVACTTVAPDATVTTSTRTYESGTIAATYGSTSCPQQFVVQLDSVPAPFGGGTMFATVDPATAISQPNCPNTVASLDIWESTDGTDWSIAFTWSGTGSWVTGSGLIPTGCAFDGGFGNSGLSGGVANPPDVAEYRVVASMTTQSTSKGTTVETEIPITVAFESEALQ